MAGASAGPRALGVGRGEGRTAPEVEARRLLEVIWAMVKTSNQAIIQGPCERATGHYEISFDLGSYELFQRRRRTCVEQKVFASHAFLPPTRGPLISTPLFGQVAGAKFPQCFGRVCCAHWCLQGRSFGPGSRLL